MTGLPSYSTEIKMEVWRAVPGLKDKYFVSNLGKVRYRDSGRIRKYCFNTNGYPTVGIRLEGKPRQMPVHRMVCLAFHGQPPADKPFVAHLNGNKLNPAAENLTWASPKENQAHRIMHGTALRGTGHPCAKLSRDQLVDIIGRVNRGEKQVSVAALHGVAPSRVSKVVNRKVYNSEWESKI